MLATPLMIAPHQQHAFGSHAPNWFHALYNAQIHKRPVPLQAVIRRFSLCKAFRLDTNEKTAPEGRSFSDSTKKNCPLRTVLPADNLPQKADKVKVFSQNL